MSADQYKQLFLIPFFIVWIQGSEPLSTYTKGLFLCSTHSQILFTNVLSLKLGCALGCQQQKAKEEPSLERAHIWHADCRTAHRGCWMFIFSSRNCLQRRFRGHSSADHVAQDLQHLNRQNCLRPAAQTRCYNKEFRPKLKPSQGN